MKINLINKISGTLFFQKHYKLISLLLLLIINSCSSESTDELAVIQKFTLIVNFSDGGSVNTVGGEYIKGSTVTVTATPNSGYSFVGWSGNSNSTEPSITLVMDGNISITASFTQIINKYTLLVLSTEGGSVDIEEEEYEEGTTVEITASAEENYQFINWTDSEGNIIGEDLIISITIDNDIQIQANFALVPENIEFSNPEITAGILSGEFAIDYQVTGEFTGIISKGVTLNDSIYTDDISEDKISLIIESLEYQEYQVKFFVQTSSGQYFSDSFTLIPNVECASVELTDTNMNLEQDFCTYEQISNIKLAYTGTNILVEYDEDLIPSGVNISNENGIVEISGTPYPTDSDNFTFDLKFSGLGDCEDITKTVTLNRSPNSPKINYISGSLNQTITAGGQIEPIEFQYAGSAESFSLSDLPDGLSYSVNGTTYKIEGSLNNAGSYTSTITTVNQSGCSEISETFSFEVNQPVSSGGGGSSESNESETPVQQLDCSGAPCRQVASQDPHWEQYIIDLGYDDELDGYFDTCKLSQITTINYPNMGAGWIGFTSGDEGSLNLADFCNLESLTIVNYFFKSLNLDNNTKLKYIELNGSVGAYWIQNIDLSNLTDLEELYAYRLGGGGNEYPLQSLDISNNNKLKQLKVGNPQNGDGIYQIVTHSSSQSNLTDLEVYNITSFIDVSNYPNLNWLQVENNNRNICIQVSQDQLDNIDSLNFYKDFRDTFSLDCN